jgi:hypothetical protein
MSNWQIWLFLPYIQLHALLHLGQWIDIKFKMCTLDIKAELGAVTLFWVGIP